jgi:hypothetical protein
MSNTDRFLIELLYVNLFVVFALHCCVLPCKTVINVI